MIKQFIFTVISCVVGISAFAQKDGDKLLLEGSIEKEPIIMRLEFSGGKWAGADYYFKKDRKTINLNMEDAPAGSLKMTMKKGFDDIVAETFTLAEKNGTWSGNWISGSKDVKISLKPIDINKIKHVAGNLDFVNTLKQTDPLGYMQSADLKFNEKPDTRNFMGYTIKQIEEPVSKIVSFKVASGYDAATLKYLNDMMMETLVKEVLNYYQCNSRNEGGEYNTSIDLHYINSDILSYSIKNYFDCGGAHPEQGLAGFNLDIKAKKLLEIEDVLFFGKGPAPAPNSDEWFTYKGEVYGPKIVELMKAAHPEQMEKPQEDCDYADSSVWNFGGWYFTESGMYIGSYFVRAVRFCDNPDWTIIPYDRLKPYIVPGFKLKIK